MDGKFCVHARMEKGAACPNWVLSRSIENRFTFRLLYLHTQSEIAPDHHSPRSQKIVKLVQNKQPPGAHQNNVNPFCPVVQPATNTHLPVNS